VKGCQNLILKKDKYNVAIAGATGAVGDTFLRILEERNFSHCRIKVTCFKAFCREKIEI